jgi:hypothetical protein
MPSSQASAKRIRSSMDEVCLQGMVRLLLVLRTCQCSETVTHVAGQICYPCCRSVPELLSNTRMQPDAATRPQDHSHFENSFRLESDTHLSLRRG